MYYCSVEAIKYYTCILNFMKKSILPIKMYHITVYEGLLHCNFLIHFQGLDQIDNYKH